MTQKHIIIVEDEKDILDVIEYNLLREGYRVSVASDGHSGLQIIRRELPHLVLLDLMLPGLDGLEVCKALKQDPSTRIIPVIMVTAKEEESDVVLGLGLGADDYIAKPFSPKELIARIKAVLRRTNENNNTGTLKSPGCGLLNIDPDRFTAQLNGKDINLTTTEFRILHALASRPGRVLKRDQLLQHASGEHVIILDRNVDVHIRAIRKALGEYRYLIETVRGIGYRFKDKIDRGT